MTDLLDQLDEPQAESWVAEEGDKIAGRILNVDVTDLGHGPYPILTIEVQGGTLKGEPLTPGETRACHLMATVQSNEVGFNRDTGRWDPERKPRRGGSIGMKYHGKKQGRNGNEYDSWRVIYTEPAPVLDQLDADDGDGPTL